jgi:hypothetical protein
MTSQAYQPIPPRIPSETSIEEKTKDAIYELIDIQREQAKDLKAIRSSTGGLFVIVLLAALLALASFVCTVVTWLGS